MWCGYPDAIVVVVDVGRLALDEVLGVCVSLVAWVDWLAGGGGSALSE